MKIVLVTNIVNHYMLPLIEELNKIEGVEAFCVETMELPQEFVKIGFLEFEDNNTIIRAWVDQKKWNQAMDLALAADVMIIGAAPKVFERERLKRNLLTFEYSERPLKRGFLNMFSPTNIKNQLHYQFLFRNKPLYMLCFSAFTALDEYRMHAFKNRCFKFGYLPRIEDLNIEDVIASKGEGKIKMLWCARFLNWKHPELPVLLAERLSKDGYDFEINMIGSGEKQPEIEKLIKERNVQKYVNLLGNFPNPEVLKIMKQHHVYLFTSDQREGWGVVLNESMGQLCCPIASDKLGSSPYLITHKKNGLFFKSQDLESLYQSTKFVLDNPQKRSEMAKNAYNTVKNVWSPQNVAERFVRLTQALHEGKHSPYYDGPCSLATPEDEMVSIETEN